MKKSVLPLFLFLLTFSLKAQEIPELIVSKACDYADNYDFKKSPSLIEEAFQKTIDQSIEDYMNDPFTDKTGFFASPEGIDSLRAIATEKLMLTCPRLRYASISYNQKKHYIESTIVEANKSYEKAELMFTHKEYKGAIKEYNKAIKADPSFVMAYDKLSLCYLYNQEYKKAAQSALKSLEIFKEGFKALINAADAYYGMQNAEESNKYYTILTQLYPEEAEGYFGLAKVAAATSDWEVALNNASKAHGIFQKKGNPMFRETQSLLDYIAREKTANPLVGDSRESHSGK